MEEVLKDWKKLALTNTEDVKLNLKKSKHSISREYVLAAKFMTRRALNIEAVGRTFKPLWRARKDFKIREAGDHILLFVFELETDAERVLATEPWSFDKHVVIFQRYDFSIPAKQLRFTKLTFWVQMHGLPLSMLDPEIAIEIGETIGTVIPSVHAKEMVGGDFLRVRVEIDVSNPICRGRKIALTADEFIWVAFKYEKLPNFCYWCGRVSHADKECEIWLASKGKLTQDQQEYGAWLRALPHNPGKISVTTVSGIGDGLGQSASMNFASSGSQSQPATVEVQNAGDSSMQMEEINEDSPAVSNIVTPGPSVITVNGADNNYRDQNSTIPEYSEIKEQAITVEKNNSEEIKVQTSQKQSAEFEEQLNAIDAALNKFDSGTNSTSETDSIPVTTDHYEDISGNILDSLQGKPITDHQGIRKWKKLARASIPSESHMQTTSLGKRIREHEEFDQTQPTKKFLTISGQGHEESMVEAAVQPRHHQ